MRDQPAEPDFEKIDVGFCRLEEREKLQKFIDLHWRKGHVLATSQSLLDWQHLDREQGRYNFVLARTGNTIGGVLGFIPLRHFDSELDPHLWLAIWKLHDELRGSSAALAMLGFLHEHLRPMSIGAIGISEMVKPIYNALGYQTGALEQWYRVNQEFSSFQLIDNFDGHYTSKADHESGVSFSQATTSDLADDGPLALLIGQSKAVPKKSPRYVRRRYLEHPFYQYDLVKLEQNQTMIGLLVLRRVAHEEGTALRLVDVVGGDAALAGCRDALQALLNRYHAEYVDFYCAGFSNDSLSRAGLLKRNHMETKTIVPAYFEPFERRNVEFYYAHNAGSDMNYRICLGDSDQDRPNHIEPIELGASE